MLEWLDLFSFTPFFDFSWNLPAFVFPEKPNVLWIRHVFVVSNHFLVIKICVHRGHRGGRSGIQVTPSLGETLSSLASTTRSCASVVALETALVGGWKQGLFGDGTLYLKDHPI